MTWTEANAFAPDDAPKPFIVNGAGEFRPVNIDAGNT
jgi:hypothetical protein